MPDPLWQDVTAELRREAAPDPLATQRIMAAVRRDRPWPRRLREWLTRPWRITVTPAGVLALLVVGIGAAVLAARLPRSPARAPAAGQPVQFVLVAPAASRVSLVGDFNDWDPGAAPMRQSRSPGVWSVVVPLEPGRHLYAFLVDGRRWEPDPSAPRDPEDDFGPGNSVILVGEQT